MKIVASLSVALLLAGCGGSESAGAISQMLGRQGEARNTHSVSSAGTLMYVANVYKAVYVLTYPKGQLYGTFELGAAIRGMCSDAIGNVFIVADGLEGRDLYEYAHGSLTPSSITTLRFGGYGCAVDPRTNNLAIADETVVVFPNEQEPYSAYPTNFGPVDIAYDSSSNLFIAGGGINGGSYQFAELPSGGTDFNSINFFGPRGEYGPLGWDGKHLTWQHAGPKSEALYRLAISGSWATVAGKTKLKGAHDIQYGTFYAGQYLAPFGTRAHRGTKIGFWSYPSGGSPESIVNPKVHHHYLRYLAISVAPSR